MLTPKATRINKLIDEIPGVCTGGREAIRNLIAEVTGENLTKVPERTFNVGDKVKYGPGTIKREYILAAGDAPYTVMAINLSSGSRRGPEVKVGSIRKITMEELRKIFLSLGDERFGF